jgi:CheY-like chemotaxis protein
MPEPPPPSGSAVLVVDGDAGVRRMLAAAFRHWGVPAHFAGDGAEAVEACRQHGAAIGMALVEVTLPRTDGPSAVAALRLLRPNLPCWLIGSSGSSSPRPDLLKCGVTGLLPKPFDLSSLRRLLDPLAASDST